MMTAADRGLWTCYHSVLPKNLQLQRNVSLDAQLKQRQSELPMNHQYKRMIQFRKNLPSYQMQQVLITFFKDIFANVILD